MALFPALFLHPQSSTCGFWAGFPGTSPTFERGKSNEIRFDPYRASDCHDTDEQGLVFRIRLGNVGHCPILARQDAQNLVFLDPDNLGTLRAWLSRHIALFVALPTGQHLII